METDGKRLLLAVVVAMGVMLAWNMLFPPEPPQKKDETAETADKAPTEDGAEQPDQGDGKPKAEADGEADVQGAPRGEEEVVTLRFDELVAEFSSYGGVLKSWELQNPRYKEDGVLLNLIRTTPEEGLPFTTHFDGSTYEVPANAEWKPERLSEREVIFRWESADLRVSKKFKIVPEDYLILVDVEFKNLSSKKADQGLQIISYSFQDPKAKSDGSMGRVGTAWKSACLVGDEVEIKGQKSVRKKTREWAGEVSWAGFTHSYFLAAIAPKMTSEDARSTCRAEYPGGRKGLMKMTLELPSITLAPGDPSYTWTTSAFYGPKYLDKLDDIDKTVDYKTRLGESVDLGWFEIIARPMLWVLKWFYSFVGNWGLAIILLTLVVKTLLLPWTHKSMVSMKKMSVLGPRMKEIQEKYKDDKATQQQRIMELYKQEGANPLSSCLPMLLQMPIWFGLYRMLMYAAELYRAPFVPGWIDDLTAPDPFHILPVLLVIVMFVQAKFTPSTGSGMQQKMLKWGMPLMFGGMSFMFPAGLTLYICINTSLTGIHHVVLRRGDKNVPAKKGGSGKKEPSRKEDAEKAVIEATATEEEVVESESAAKKNSNAQKGKSGKKRGNKGKKKGKR